MEVISCRANRKEKHQLIFIVIVLLSVIPVGIEIIRGMAAKREATAFGTDSVEEFIEEHEGGKHREK